MGEKSRTEGIDGEEGKIYILLISKSMKKTDRGQQVKRSKRTPLKRFRGGRLGVFSPLEGRAKR